MTATQAAENHQDEWGLTWKSFGYQKFFGQESFAVTLDVFFITKCMPIKYFVAIFEKYIRVFFQHIFSTENAECTEFINCKLSKLI